MENSRMLEETIKNCLKYPEVFMMHEGNVVQFISEKKKLGIKMSIYKTPIYSPRSPFIK